MYHVARVRACWDEVNNPSRDQQTKVYGHFLCRRPLILSQRKTHSAECDVSARQRGRTAGFQARV